MSLWQTSSHWNRQTHNTSIHTTNVMFSIYEMRNTVKWTSNSLLQPLTTSFAMRPRGQTRVALLYTLIGCSTREAATSPVVHCTHTRWKSVVKRLHVYALRGGVSSLAHDSNTRRNR